MDIAKRSGQRSMFWSYPVGYGSHGTERTPSAWRIDEIQYDTDNGGHHDYRPEYTPDTAPHRQASFAPRNGESQLDAEHREDEEHHKQAETERAHELGNRPMR